MLNLQDFMGTTFRRDETGNSPQVFFLCRRVTFLRKPRHSPTEEENLRKYSQQFPSFPDEK
jgi:hypothetical protein